MGANSASPSPLPSRLSTGKAKRFRNVSVTNIHVSLLDTVIVSCFRRCYKSYSLRKRWNRKIHKLELFAEWIFALCTCGNLKTSHQSNCCLRAGKVTVHMNRLFGDNIQKLKIASLRQDFPKQNHAIEMSLSNRISVELLLPCYACRLFLWTIAFPNHTHVISLLLIFADTCRTTELYTFHLGYFQISLR